MSSYVEKAKAILHTTTTYRAGLLQTKATRVLKLRTNNSLAPSDITSTEWALLGILKDSSKSIRLSELAEELGVEAPFVTATLRKLTKQGYVETEPDKKDSRAKRICLTPEGRVFVNTVEPILRNAMRPLLKDISIPDLATYFSVMTKIIRNSENL